MILHIQKLSHFLWKMGFPFLPRLLYALNRVVFATVIPPSVHVGKNDLLGYSGLGIAIHSLVVMGNNVKISQHVTIGGRSGLIEVPVIEDGVEVGAVACILGPVRLGAGAVVGANAVVLCDVPNGKVAVGVPARIL